MGRTGSIGGAIYHAEGGAKFRRNPRRTNPAMRPDLTEAFTEVLHPSYKIQLDEAVARLKRAGIPFFVAGGIAVSAYGEPRGTKDIDLLLPLEVWRGSSPLVITAPLNVSDLPKIELIVMPRSIEELEDIAARTALTWEGIPIVAPEVLVVMKLEADRLQDRADIATLLEAGLSEKQVHHVLDQLPPATATRLRKRLAAVVKKSRQQLKNKLLR